MAAADDVWDKRYYTERGMIPYSKKLDRHLRIILRYPRNTPKAFLDEFERLMEGFEKHVTAGK
jgi:hypothetical protein